MRNTSISTIAFSLVVALTSATAARADDSQYSGSGTASGAVQTAKKGAGSILGVMTGLTVGVPISIVRSIGVETKRMKAQVSDDTAGGDHPDAFAHLAGTTMGLIYGVPSGIIKGSIQGAERGITRGADKPFSADSLSLGDLQMEYKTRSGEKTAENVSHSDQP